VDDMGNIGFSILNNGAGAYSLAGSVAVNDGIWHHVLTEVNRLTLSANIYIDGVLANGTTSGVMPVANVSLTNAADLLVGKNLVGNYFAGTMDFMRISKGTLADAKTSIDELYKWEFNGPFLRDFAGNLPIGKRDAGAIERGAKLCNMTVSSNPLYFDLKGGTQSFTIEAENGFEVVKKIGTFYTTLIVGNTVNVTVSALTSGTRSGEIDILGCNETLKVKIIQQPITAINLILQSEIKVMPNPVSGQQLTISIPNGLKVKNARFTDMNGKLVSESILTEGINTMDIKFPHGIYLVKIIGPEVNYTTKIVVN